MAVERVRQMSVEEYLDFTETSEEWYEYIDGELYPMTPPIFRHNVISFNIGLRLGMLLADRNCQTLGMGQGILVGETKILIPDVSVVCGDPVLEYDTRLLLNPVLVGEVLSPSTANMDRGDKRNYYFDVPSIAIYLVIDPQRPNAELHTRAGAGWRIDSYANIDDELPLDALNCSLALRDIYRNVEFESLA